MSDVEVPQGRDLSVPIEKLMGPIAGYGLLLMVLPVLFFMIFHGWRALTDGFRPLILLLLLIIFTLAHEGFHAVGWKYWGELPWRAIKLGIMWEALAPYAHATQPMRVDAYRLGTVLPGIMTGLVPYVMTLVIGNGVMVIVSAVMISGAIGDLYVLWLIRELPPDAMVMDHPKNVGCVVVQEGTANL
jgi:hypothetical protein